MTCQLYISACSITRMHKRSYGACSMFIGEARQKFIKSLTIVLVTKCRRCDEMADITWTHEAQQFILTWVRRLENMDTEIQSIQLSNCVHWVLKGCHLKVVQAALHTFVYLVLHCETTSIKIAKSQQYQHMFSVNVYFTTNGQKYLHFIC